MADQPAASTTSQPSTSPVVAPPAPKSSRAPMLLGVLAVLLAWYAYDYFVAKPQSEAADKAIQKLADDRNKQGITGEDGQRSGDGRVTSADIQKLLGRAPYSTKQEKEYTVETYWWYSLPHRNYISVLYVGNEPRRYNTHYPNRMPPEEDLPTEFVPPSGGSSESTESSELQPSEGQPDVDGGATGDKSSESADQAPAETPAEIDKPATKDDGQ